MNYRQWGMCLDAIVSPIVPQPFSRSRSVRFNERCYWNSWCFLELRGLQRTVHLGGRWGKWHEACCSFSTYSRRIFLKCWSARIICTCCLKPFNSFSFLFNGWPFIREPQDRRIKWLMIVNRMNSINLSSSSLTLFSLDSSLEPPPWISFNSLITCVPSYHEYFAYAIMSTKNVFFFPSWSSLPLLIPQLHLMYYFLRRSYWTSWLGQIFP